jgi:hypothetical protein
MTRLCPVARCMTERWRACRVGASFLMLLVISGLSARAETLLYGISANGLYRLDPANSVSTTVYSATPFPVGGTSPAAIAQCPNGMIYFSTRTGSGNGSVYSYNPYTPTVAPILLGSTGAGTPDMLRATCDPSNGTVYMDGSAPGSIYTISKTTGAATGTAVTLPGTTPPATGSGDFGFGPGGTLYYVGETTAGNASTVRLYTINLITSTISNVGAITGLPAVANGIGFNAAGQMLLSLTGITQLYTAPITGGAATAVGSTGALTALTDLSSMTLLPDLAITKTDFTPGIAPLQTTTYSIVATNNASFASTGTVTDTPPASLTSVSWTCTPSAGSSCAAASGTGNISATVTLAAGGTATFSLTATAVISASGTIVNSATVALPFAFMTDNMPANNSASDTDTVVAPVLSATKVSSVISDPLNGTTNPKRIPGALIDYSITTSNSTAGFVDNNATIFTDPIPPGTSMYVLDITAGNGPVAFTQGSPSSTLSYTYTTLTNPGDSLAFSNDGGLTFAYAPTADPTGVDSAVTHVRVSLSGRMAANSSFNLAFRTVVK